MSIIKDALQDVCDLLEDEESWTQGNFATTETKKIVPVDSPQASCWCIMGAAMRTSLKRGLNKDQTAALVSALRVGVHAATGSSLHSITHFNDHHSHAEVMSMLNDITERWK